MVEEILCSKPAVEVSRLTEVVDPVWTPYQAEVALGRPQGSLFIDGASVLNKS